MPRDEWAAARSKDIARRGVRIDEANSDNGLQSPGAAIISFGLHHGKRIENVPLEYLKWAVESCHWLRTWPIFESMVAFLYKKGVRPNIEVKPDKAMSFNPRKLDKINKNQLRDQRRERSRREKEYKRRKAKNKPMVMRIGFEDNGDRCVDFDCLCVVQFNRVNPNERKGFFCNAHRDEASYRELIETLAVQAVK